MKFTTFKEFRQLLGVPSEIVGYLRNELATTMRELNTGLSRLTFSENFRSFQVTITDLPQGEEIRIKNELRAGASFVEPTKYLIVKRSAGAEYIVDGDTAWDSNYVHLKNNHPTASTTATFTVIFLE